ncbi:hypothetical protein XANCAGTX0491_009588 [Xanthoria calcicola]
MATSQSVPDLWRFKYHHRHDDAATTQSGTSDDGVLRRFEEVGHLLINGLDGWVRTGHVLVLDMDTGRNRQPWIIPASEWEVEVGYESETVSAPRKIARKNKTRALGIFPRHGDRTTIARIHAQSGESNPLTPLLLQFGPDFNFRVEEYGYSNEKGTSQGPELARVMPWVKKVEWSDWQQITDIAQCKAPKQKQPEEREAPSRLTCPFIGSN